MAVNSPKSTLVIPERMEAKLKQFRKRVWLIKLGEALLAAAFGLLTSYLLVFALDRFFDTPVIIRIAILCAGVFGLGIWLPWMCHKWIWKSRRLDQIARLLRYKFPRLGDHLLGIIELVNIEGKGDRSEDLCRAALKQVDEETKDRDFSNAVPAPRHRQWALIAGVTALIALIGIVLVPLASTNAFARWLMPWKNIDRYTFADLETLPEKLIVPFGEKSNLSAQLTAASSWNPQKGLAVVNGQRIDADNQNGNFSFEIPPLNEPSDVQVRIGDVRTSVAVEPVTRPELASLTAEIKLPKYLKRQHPVVKDIRGGSVSVLGGSELSIYGSATRDLFTASVDQKPIATNGRELSTSPVSFESTSEFAIDWEDNLGLSPRTPLVLNIRAKKDLKPSLTCKQLARKRVLMEKDVLSFEVIAEDDFGLKTIGMEWEGIPRDELDEPAKGEKIVAAGSPESNELNAIATFSPKREQVTPQPIQLRLYAEDYLPDRERIYSPTYTVYVLSEVEHAIWLTKQINQWYKKSLETYDREQSLFRENQLLRGMSADELDRPETRRKIESQAAAEKAQSRRLGALNNAGTELVKAATQNDQFNVATLEKLSEMLAKLENISDNRMPSVSDLLTKAAEAPGRTENSPSPTSVGKAEPSEGKSGSSKSKLVPSIAINEPSMDKPDSESKKPDPSAPSPGKLSLPVVKLADNSKSEDNESCPSQNKMEQAVEEQEALMTEFQSIADELGKLVTDLEGSTFVKRLKAMAKKQLEVATDVNVASVGHFGKRKAEVSADARSRAELIAEREVGYKELVGYISDDLEAYSNRSNDGKFKAVLAEMKKENVSKQLQQIADKINSNEPGASKVHTELLADTFDRWAEQLVGPG